MMESSAEQRYTEVTIGGRTFKLRPPSIFLARQVQPNLLMRQVQQAKDGEMDELTALDMAARIEKILRLIIVEPPVYVPKDIDDLTPPGYITAYDMTEQEITGIIAAWAAPYMKRMQRLEDEAGPLSQT